MPTQYVAVRFHPADRRHYTYHSTGEKISVGEHIIVPSPKGDQTVEVVSVSPVPPSFPTKAVIGKAAL